MVAARRLATALALLIVVLLQAGCLRTVPAPGTATDSEATQSVEPTETAISGYDPLRDLKPAPGYREVRPAPYSWLAEPGLFAHGLGGIGGMSVTNSMEAFESNYERGHRLFEVDLVFTSDGHLVARHDWEPYLYTKLEQEVADKQRPLSLADFKAHPIHRTMTPLSIEDLVALMRAYPDTWVITDTKSKETEDVRAAMQAIVEAIGDDKGLADRFIIQIYDEKMLSTVREVHDFKNFIYTLYQIEGTTDRAAEFARENGIRLIAIPKEMYKPALVDSFKRRGLKVGIYTVNDPAVAADLRRAGIDFIYTDSLEPGQ